MGEATLDKLTKVWDGEVCGVRGPLEDAPSETNVLIQSDSQAAIASLKKAGRTGRARTADLRRVMMDNKERQTRLGPNALSLGWGKAHNQVQGNEKAEQLAKHATTLYPKERQIKEGGLKLAWKKKREEERRVKSAGMGKVEDMRRQAST